MAQYSTGDLARLCGVTVRTVQYYDSKGLLCPTDLTEGGRRIYTEEDVEKLRTIRFLKDLDFSLKDISILVNDPDTTSTLRFLLVSQQQALEKKIAGDRAKLSRLKELRNDLSHFNTFTPETLGVVADIMDGKKKLRNMRIKMVLVGIVMDAAWIAPLIYGIVSGIWWPLAIGAAIAVALGVAISHHYITHTAYVCPEDQTIFRPPLRQHLLAAHTPSMRKLTCPTCEYKGYCLEIYVPDSTPMRDGKYLIWTKAAYQD